MTPQPSTAPSGTSPVSPQPSTAPVAPGVNLGAVNGTRTEVSSSAVTQPVDPTKPETARDPQVMVPESARDAQVMVPESARD